MITSIFLLSCEKQSDAIITLRLDNAINNGRQEIDIKKYVEQEKLIPLETNDSLLLSYVSLIGIDDNKLFVESDRVVYVFNAENGALESRIDRKGQGPEEYQSMIDVEIDNRNKTILLYDNIKRNLVAYDFKGNFISSVKNDIIGGFSLLDDSTYLVAYPPLSGQSTRIGVYDKNLNLRQQFLAIDESVYKDMDLFPFDDFGYYGEKAYFKPMLEDTLYVIDSSPKPYLILSKGKYKIPTEVAINVMKRNRDGHKYISGEYGYILGDYYFLTYFYQNAMFQDVWNIKTPELLFRNIVDENNQISGIPYEINGYEFYIWPKFVSNNTMYCVIDADDAINIIPSLPEDTNPVILKLELK